LSKRLKSDAATLASAAWLRRETIFSHKSLARRAGLGSSRSANTKLHNWMQANKKLDGAAAEGKKGKNHAKKTHRTKA
jgi:hypothetical protein